MPRSRSSQRRTASRVSAPRARKGNASEVFVASVIRLELHMSALFAANRVDNTTLAQPFCRQLSLKISQMAGCASMAMTCPFSTQRENGSVCVPIFGSHVDDGDAWRNERSKDTQLVLGPLAVNPKRLADDVVGGQGEHGSVSAVVSLQARGKTLGQATHIDSARRREDLRLFPAEPLEI